jgi:hypothetical protein
VNVTRLTDAFYKFYRATPEDKEEVERIKRSKSNGVGQFKLPEPVPPPVVKKPIIVPEIPPPPPLEKPPPGIISNLSS